jgi:hypothetical protein
MIANWVEKWVKGMNWQFTKGKPECPINVPIDAELTSVERNADKNHSEK